MKLGRPQLLLPDYKTPEMDVTLCNSVDVEPREELDQSIWVPLSIALYHCPLAQLRFQLYDDLGEEP